ncbi:ribosomal protein L1, partial [Piedraia hortae CBS 480.64]
TPYALNDAQTLKAASALLSKLHSTAPASKPSAHLPGSTTQNLLSTDGETPSEVSIWLILTTKTHISDTKRLKPGKITLPYTLHGDSDLRICLITADPQRKYKNLLASSPLIKKVIGLEKLKARYTSFESRRQLAGEYDLFLADDRVITYLPAILGKVFYKSGTKRPVPVCLMGRRENFDEKGHKRKRLVEGGERVTRKEVTGEEIEREVSKAVRSAVVHLAPSTTTAVRVGHAGLDAAQVKENVTTVVEELVEKWVPQKWRGVRAIHIKGPNTAALPVWLTDELWIGEEQVWEELPRK